MSATTQEGIIMMTLLVGSIIVWGVWLVRFLRRWEDEERRFRDYQIRMTEIERRRIEARNYRYSHE